MTDAHQDVAGVVGELRERSLQLNGRSIDRGCQDSGISANLADAAADLIESLSKALSEAAAEAGVSFRCGVAHQERASEMEARALAAESRLAEAMIVLIGLLERCEYQPTYADGRKGPPGLNLSGWRERDAIDAAHRFLNAGKE